MKSSLSLPYVDIVLDPLSNIDLSLINFEGHEGLRQLVLVLMNRIEALEQTVLAVKEENQHLRDENARLKGEKPKPKFKPNTTKNDSKAKPKQKRRRRSHPKRKDRIQVDETQILDVEDLPPDVRFLGYRDVIVQDIVFERRNVRYRLKRYYSEVEGRFYEAASPAKGQGYGAQLRAFVLMAYYGLRIPQQKIVDLLRAQGIVISEGQVSRLLTKEATAKFEEEYKAIVEAGLSTSEHQHIDHTGLRQKGIGHHVAVLCTKAYAAFFINRYRNKTTVRDLVKDLLGGTLTDHIKVLVSDNAGEFMTQEMLHQLCWVHEIRHYKKLKGAYFKSFHREKEAFLDRLHAYYDCLRQWRKDPSEAEALGLEAEFDTLFSGEGVTFDALKKRIALTHARKEELLLCLTDARIPLENNEAERSLREIVVKRKISYGTRSETGSKAWSVMLTLVETARKQGVNLYGYLHDRLSGERAMPSLASSILNAAAQPTLATPE